MISNSLLLLLGGISSHDKDSAQAVGEIRACSQVGLESDTVRQNVCYGRFKSSSFFSFFEAKQTLNDRYM